MKPLKGYPGVCPFWWLSRPDEGGPCRNYLEEIVFRRWLGSLRWWVLVVSTRSYLATQPPGRRAGYNIPFDKTPRDKRMDSPPSLKGYPGVCPFWWLSRPDEGGLCRNYPGEIVFRCWLGSLRWWVLVVSTGSTQGFRHARTSLLNHPAGGRATTSHSTRRQGTNIWIARRATEGFSRQLSR